MVWVGCVLRKFTNKKFPKAFWINNEKGQTAVEYILVVAMVAFLVSSGLRSKLFRDFFGDEGKFVEAVAKNLEFNYQHANFGNDGMIITPLGSSGHRSYKGSNGEETRFFIGRGAYPEQ